MDEADSGLELASERCAALIDALRVAAAPPDVLEAVRTQLEAAAALLAPFARPGPHSQSVPGMSTQRFFELGQFDPHALMPYSPIIGRLNPVSPRLEFRTEGGRLLGRGRIPVRFVGAPGTVHGGIVAAALDEIMGLVNVLNGEGAFTGTMSVRFHRPTPIERELELLGETVGKDGRKILSRAEIRCDGELMASAEGVFIRPRAGMQPP